MFILELLSALNACGSSAFLVHCNVLIEIGFLGKRLATLGLWTQEGSLSSVDAKVVKKVMPLSEEHAAATVVTFQQFDMSLCPWIFILKNPELACRRNLLFNFNA